MARKASRPEAKIVQRLEPLRVDCPDCGRKMWADYSNRRTVATLEGLVRLEMTIRRCRNEACGRCRKPYRPEAEGGWALPQHEFGLDVVALVGALRYAEHRSVPEIHQALVAPRTVGNLLDRYDELLATVLSDDARLRSLLAGQGRVVLAIDGLQPDVGHEVLWVLRDCLSGVEVLGFAEASTRSCSPAACFPVAARTLQL